MMLIERHLEVPCRVFGKPREHLLVHARHPRGRVEQPLAVGVFPNAFQYQANTLLYLGVVHGSSSCETARRLYRSSHYRRFGA